MRRFIAVLSVLALYACDSGGGPAAFIGTGGNSSIAGTYILQTVNGAPLPYEFPVPGVDKYEILDDKVVLNDDGSWTEVGHDRKTVKGIVTLPVLNDGGTYTISGTMLTFSSTTPGAPTARFQGTLSGNTLILPAVSSTGQSLTLSLSK
jgi:hypothetical protein